MKSRLLLILILSFMGTILAADACLAQEQVTITTYYPAPYGIYRELRTDQMSVGSGYRSTPLGNGNLIVEGSVAIGSPNITEKLRVEGNVAVSGNITPNQLCLAGVCKNSWSACIRFSFGPTDPVSTDCPPGTSIAMGPVTPATTSGAFLCCSI